MKRAKYLVLMLLVPLLILGGCGKKETKYYDSEFITALEQGLQDRWAISDTLKDPGNISKDSASKMVDAELKAVKDYPNKKFKNAKLHEQALAYVNAVKEQQATIKKYNSNSFITLWNKAYDKRTKAILSINKIHKLKVDPKYESNLTELTRNGDQAANKDKQNQQIDQLVKTIKFKLTKNDYGYKTYAANVKNTTDFSFKQFDVNVKLLNAKKTVVETQFIPISDWDKGQTNRFEFSTDKEFTNYKVVKEFIEQK